MSQDLSKLPLFTRPRRHTVTVERTHGVVILSVEESRVTIANDRRMSSSSHAANFVVTSPVELESFKNQVADLAWPD